LALADVASTSRPGRPAATYHKRPLDGTAPPSELLAPVACRSSSSAAYASVVVGSGWSGTVLDGGVIASADALCLDVQWRRGHLALAVPACYAAKAACRGHFRNSLVRSTDCGLLGGQNRRKRRRSLRKEQEREIRNVIKNHDLFPGGPSAPAINSGAKHAE
jgi:hypothetical protein